MHSGRIVHELEDAAYTDKICRQDGTMSPLAPTLRIAVNSHSNTYHGVDADDVRMNELPSPV